MNNECRYCPGFMTGTCKKRSYNSEECKNWRDKYDKEMRRCLKTHCLHCGKRKDIPDGWDVVKEIHKELKNLWLDATDEDEEFAYSRAIYCVKDHLEKAGIEIEEE